MVIEMQVQPANVALTVTIRGFPAVGIYTS